MMGTPFFEDWAGNRTSNYPPGGEPRIQEIMGYAPGMPQYYGTSMRGLGAIPDWLLQPRIEAPSGTGEPLPPQLEQLAPQPVQRPLQPAAPILAQGNGEPIPPQQMNLDPRPAPQRPAQRPRPRQTQPAQQRAPRPEAPAPAQFARPLPNPGRPIVGNMARGTGPGPDPRRLNAPMPQAPAPRRPMLPGGWSPGTPMPQEARLQAVLGQM